MLQIVCLCSLAALGFNSLQEQSVPLCILLSPWLLQHPLKLSCTNALSFPQWQFFFLPSMHFMPSDGKHEKKNAVAASLSLLIIARRGRVGRFGNGLCPFPLEAKSCPQPQQDFWLLRNALSSPATLPGIFPSRLCSISAHKLRHTHTSGVPFHLIPLPQP